MFTQSFGLTTLDLAQKDDTTFVATQIDNADHHIVGGHIAAQALMAASRTVACGTAGHCPPGR